MTDPHQILDEFFDSAMGREELQRLESMICMDDEFALAFARAVLMESHLRTKYRRDDLISIFQMGEGAPAVERAIENLKADYQSADPMLVDLTEELTRREMSARTPSSSRHKPDPADDPARVIVIPRAVVWAVAAMVLAAAWIGWSELRSGGDGEGVDLVQAPADEHAQPVATLVSGVDAHWSGGDPSLRPGTPVTLESGLAEVRFDDGALVFVQGPATFVATGPNSVRLTHGRVTASVPASAIGFRVDLPNATVTDLGTEFGVALGEDGASRAEVFSGLVHLRPAAGLTGGADADAQPIPIHQKQAMAVDVHGRATAAEPEPLAFIQPEEYRVIRAARDGDPYSIWLARQYQLRRDPDVIAYYLFDEQDEQAGRLINRASSTGAALDAELGGADGPAPLWRDGRLPATRALEFGFADEQATRRAVVPDGPALRIGQALTLVAWVYVDNHWRPPSGTILSKRDIATQRMAFQFSVMADKHRGGSFALQLGMGADTVAVDGFVYSGDATRYYVAGWNQLAVTADGRAVRFYINGRHVAQAPQPYPSYNNGAPLLIGTSRPDLQPPLAFGPVPFEGRIGELLIATRVFSAEEIGHDYQHGSRLR